ncbi:C2 domain containing protein [Trichomonas vaginalis G3]|uniref:C2 domain containing protein n=1 Tax=Trichomonas vaginalis (strain ATCC PRA-98 / G3) TaxID=412133 RepID=A2DRS3_TRIV3|nr:guanyl-nucleotide exchange factor protein [Trichomonas vaginalis G3]EAY16870.1 C2 domain containing protein [Trichomonas vaginalis G3]KAI5489143.1 guanyl-nucleotide exchange factor protein [Trichomonas vaginalis G3]|eukprot:XP_001329093.1 C2 domain containing protein [Trichomonas vaginalis G3]
MYSITILSCENVANADDTPSCFVKVYLEANGLNLYVGKTNSSKKQGLLKWDKNMGNNMATLFVYTDVIRFELYTKDFLGGKELLAAASVQSSQVKSGSLKLKSHYSRDPNRTVYFNVKIEFIQFQFPFIKNTLSQQFYFYYLTFDPEVSYDPFKTNCYFHFITLDPESKKPSLYSGSDAKDGIYFNYSPVFSGPSGLTQVCIIDPRAVKGSMRYLPVLVNHGYRGRVSLNVAFSARPTMTSSGLSLIAPEHNKLYSKNAISLNVESDGALPFGCVVNVADDISHVSYDPIDLSLDGILSQSF